MKARFEVTRLPDAALAVWLDTLGPYINESPSPTIVDLGSGFGHFSILFARHFNARVVAIEPDEGVRREAAKRNSYSSVIYMAGDGEHVPVQKEEVDTIFISHVLTSLPDLPAALGEMVRILRPGGSILVRDIFRGGTEGIPMYEFFPDSRRTLEASLVPSDLLVQASLDADLLPVVHDIVRQEYASSFHEYTDRVRALVAAGLIGTDELERERGMTAMERRCSLELHPTPVYEREEIVVLKKK